MHTASTSVGCRRHPGGVCRSGSRSRGRVLGTQNTFVTAASPLGIFLAGALTEATGIHVALIILASGWALGLVIALFAQAMRNLDAPGVGVQDGREMAWSA